MPPEPSRRPTALVTAPFRGPGVERLRGVADMVIDPWIEHRPLRLYDAQGLAERGFETFIVQDAVGSRRPEDCSAAIERMRAAGAAIVTAEMVMFEWLHRADVPEWPELLRIVKEA